VAFIGIRVALLTDIPCCNIVVVDAIVVFCCMDDVVFDIVVELVVFVIVSLKLFRGIGTLDSTIVSTARMASTITTSTTM
jgi:hypothetical protein